MFTERSRSPPLVFMPKEEPEFRIPPSQQDSTGAFLIDRNPTYFEPILDYLRHGELIMGSNINPAGILILYRKMKNNFLLFKFLLNYRSS